MEEGIFLYDSAEITQKALCRASQKRARQTRGRRTLAVVLWLGTCSLSMCFVALSGQYTRVAQLPVSGSMTVLNGATAGAYALAGVIGFLLGTGLTLWHLRKRRR